MLHLPHVDLFGSSRDIVTCPCGLFLCFGYHDVCTSSAHTCRLCPYKKIIRLSARSTANRPYQFDNCRAGYEIYITANTML